MSKILSTDRSPDRDNRRSHSRLDKALSTDNLLTGVGMQFSRSEPGCDEMVVIQEANRSDHLAVPAATEEEIDHLGKEEEATDHDIKKRSPDHWKLVGTMGSENFGDASTSSAESLT